MPLPVRVYRVRRKRVVSAALGRPADAVSIRRLLDDARPRTFVASALASAVVTGGGTSAGSTVSTREPGPITALPDQPQDPRRLLRISRVRMHDTKPGEIKPSVKVTFHTSNDSSDTLEQVVFAIAIVERLTAAAAPGVPPRTVAGPFIFRADAVLEPGYTTDFEVVLRDISIDCGCIPQIRVLSVR